MALIARRSYVLLQAVLLATLSVAPAVVQAAEPAATSTILVSSLNPSVRPLPVTFTATVALADGTAPVTVGTVKFGRGSSCTAGFTQLQSARPVDASGRVTFTNQDIGIGTTTIWACYEGVAGQTLNSGASVDQVVAAAPVPTTLVVAPASGPFGGTADLSATLTLTSTGAAVAGVPVGFTLAGAPVGSATTDASGTATLAAVSLAGIGSGSDPTGVGASFAGNAARAPSSGSAALTVGPAAEETTVTTVTCAPGPFVYSGAPITPCSVTVVGSDGLSLTPDPVYSDNVGAGTATASYAYPGDATHDGSSDSETFVIGPAGADCDIAGFSGPYDGLPHGATGSCTGVLGEDLAGGLELGATFTDVPGGTAAWSFAAANYHPQSGEVAIDIARAPSDVAISCPAEVTYTGSPVTPCTASVTGAGGLDEAVDVAYEDNVVGLATATATYPGDANHLGDTASAQFLIGYAWSGYLQPINDTGHQVGVDESRFRLGQTIPAKFILRDAFGNVVTQATSPTFSRSGNLGTCDVDAAGDSVPDVEPTGGTDYAWNGGKYHFNWRTKGLTPGEYRIFANLDDGTRHSVDICLTR